MKSKSSNRSFGLLFAFVFLIIAFWPLKNSGLINVYLVILSALFLLLSLLRPAILSPLNKIWVKFGEIIGIVVAPIVMGLIYFLILTPISILVRLFGKDLLNIKFLKNVNTYWIERKKKISSMKKQF
jgi:hypothetical protein